MANEKILVVDDDKNICELLRLYLVKEGYNVTMVHDGGAALAEFDKLHPDLVLLDVMMPVMDGWEVCRKIRAKDNTPIIMLTAKGETYDKVLGLEMGADDYIVKPFSPREIVSRIRVIFRRINSLETAQEKNELQIGNTRINLSRYEVCVDGEKVVFSTKEVEILHLMAAHLNQVFTREQLLDSIWGFDFDGDSRVVDTSIKRIRKKLPEYSMLAVRSVYGVGYKIEAANA